MKKALPFYKKYKYLILAGILILLLIPLYFLKNYLDALSPEPTPVVQAPIKKVEVPKKVEPVIPESYVITVPYTVQAPNANWAVHEESCEEAALLMYHNYLLGQAGDIPATSADQQFRAMKAWQVKNYGKEPDLSINRLGEFAQSYYSDVPRVLTSLDQATIKKEISAGHPILVPVLTQSLKNPHYSPGNVYHILLLRGYDATGVITNDAGVKEGKNWHYSWEILFSAIDAQSQKMNQGRVGLVLTKN